MTNQPALTYPMFQQRNNGDIYNWHLSSVERVQGRVYDPSFGLASDPLVYEKMLRTPVIKHAVTQRATEVAGRDWLCVPASKSAADVRVAEIMQDLLGEIGHFTAARFRLAHAFFYGSAYEEMRGDFQRVRLSSDDRVRRWYLVEELKNVDKRRFTRWKAGEGHVWAMWSVHEAKWSEVKDHERFVKHVYDDREAYLGFGSGLVDALFWYAYALSVAEREGLGGLERWSRGLVTMKLNANREASTGRTNDALVEETIQRLRSMVGRHVMVYGEGDELNVVETSGAGNRIVIDFMQELKGDITRLILGSLRPTGGGAGSSTGARAQADVEADASEAIYRYDQGESDETVSHDVIGYLWDMNRPIFAEMGLAHARRPKFVTVKKRIEDPTTNATNVATLLQAGVTLAEEDVFTKTGFRQPRPGEKVIRGGAVGFGGGFPGSAAPGSAA